MKIIWRKKPLNCVCFPLGGILSKERWCIWSKHWQFWPSFANKEKMERVFCAQHQFSFLIPMHCLSIRGFTQTHPLSSIRILTNSLLILPTYLHIRHIKSGYLWVIQVQYSHKCKCIKDTNYHIIAYLNKSMLSVNSFGLSRALSKEPCCCSAIQPPVFCTNIHDSPAQISFFFTQKYSWTSWVHIFSLVPAKSNLAALHHSKQNIHRGLFKFQKQVGIYPVPLQWQRADRLYFQYNIKFWNI